MNRTFRFDSIVNAILIKDLFPAGCAIVIPGSEKLPASAL